MLLKRLRRLLDPPDHELRFHAADPDDPRLGDLVVDLEDVVGGSTTRCVIVGCPQHIGIERNGGRSGAAEAPRAIRTMLYRMATSSITEAVSMGRLSIADAGNVETEGKTLEQIHDELHDVVEALITAGFFPIVLGGGHDCVWPVISAYEEIGQAFGIINIDAHADVRPLKDGSKAHSGSPFRQMLDADDSALASGAFIEFGLQHQGVAQSHIQYLIDRGATVMMLERIRQEGVEASWNAVTERTEHVGRYHITLDIDGFASAYAPGVSAPATNGFTPDEIGPLLRRSAIHHALTSFDVVEVSPPHDTDGRTSRLAAYMIMEVLAGLAQRQ
jgi:formiminoglutamase